MLERCSNKLCGGGSKYDTGGMYVHELQYVRTYVRTYILYAIYAGISTNKGHDNHHHKSLRGFARCLLPMIRWSMRELDWWTGIGSKKITCANTMPIFWLLRSTPLDQFFHGDTAQHLTNHKMSSRQYPTHWPLIFFNEQISLQSENINEVTSCLGTDCSSKCCWKTCLWFFIVSQSEAEFQDVFTHCYRWTTQSNQEKDYCQHSSVRLFWWLHTYFRCSSCR